MHKDTFDSVPPPGRRRGFLSRLTGLSAATVFCLAGAALSAALAFLGSERAGNAMGHPAVSVLLALSAGILLFCAARAAARKRPASFFLHAGCVLILAGWLWGRIAAARAARPGGRPLSGAMALIDGDESDLLCGGDRLTVPLGKTPFTVRLERFLIDYYPDDTVREYRSRVTIAEPGRAPYVRNIRVNHPVRAGGYDIYQMSWGRTRDAWGRPRNYTVLEFIRDPGLPLVYAGYAVLFAGVLLFAFRVCSLSGRGRA